VPSEDTRRLANGKWFEILTKLGGIDSDFLQDRHGPCPLCAGEDRWRWDDRDGDGGGYCNRCGGKHQAGGAISGFDLLMRSKGWSFNEAANEVTQFLGGAVVPTTTKKPRKPARIPEKPPIDALPPALGRAVAQWCLKDLDGEQLYWIQRYEDASKPDKRGKPRKTLVHRTWLDGGWHFPKRTDPFTSEWPSPRPLLGQHELRHRPDAPVLVVEGETTYDAACFLFPKHVIITWTNGSKNVGHADWSPLTGRSVTIWPDNDDDGKQCTAKLIRILQGLGSEYIAVVNPPPDSPTGWDLADAGGWDEVAASKYLSGNVIEVEVAVDAGGTSPPEPPQRPSDGDAKPKRPFGLLGFAGDNFYYQPDESGQVTIIARAKHSATNMLGLARLAYWSKEFPRFDKKTGNFIGIDWQCAFDTLFAEQYRIGFFDPDSVRGLGAWWDDGRVVLHLGDRLIVDGTTHLLTRPFQSKYCYQRLRRLEGPGKAIPLTDDEAMQVLEIAATFMWEDKSSAFLLAGWIALAPICGALSWRPHVWLTAASGTGKSTILERFVGILLGDMFVQPEGKSTEPSIRQELMSSALAVVLDEAEQNKEGDKLRVQSILDFARSCSSEGKGQIMKGSSDQSGAKKFRAKAMFLMSSVATALKEGADKSRFAQLTLRKNEKQSEAERAKHWIQLDGVLRELITEDFALRLIARTINLIPMIRDASRIFATAAAEHLGTQRLGDQYGALAAGAWSLCHQQAPTLDEAREWIAANPLTAHAEASEVADEKSCLQTILEHQIRVDVDGGAKNRTVLALLRIVRNRTIAGEEGIDDSRASKALGRLGLRVNTDSNRLEISNTAKGLKRLLRETAWESCWPTVLGRMDGASKPGAVWFPEIGTSRATALPMPELE
jgi:putative DNA primase/helicase